MVWCDMVWYGMVWYGMVWYGMVWYGIVCMVWYCIVLQSVLQSPNSLRVSGEVKIFQFVFATIRSSRIRKASLVVNGRTLNSSQN